MDDSSGAPRTAIFAVAIIALILAAIVGIRVAAFSRTTPKHTQYEATCRSLVTIKDAFGSTSQQLSGSQLSSADRQSAATLLRVAIKNDGHGLPTSVRAVGKQTVAYLEGRAGGRKSPTDRATVARAAEQLDGWVNGCDRGQKG